MKTIGMLMRIIGAIIFWIISLILLYETILSFIHADPWGVTFAFYTLPIGTLGILFLVMAIALTKGFIIHK